MPANLDGINFRTLANQFLLVKNMDEKTKAMIENAGFSVRPEDNAMLVYGYIDQEVGLSFELLCAACACDDGEVLLGPVNHTTAFKFRYGSFDGEVLPFTDESQLHPFLDRARKIDEAYQAPEDVELLRTLKDIDPLRAPGYPDDLLVVFLKEGLQKEGIWCRTEEINRTENYVWMRMLNEPAGSFGKHVGDLVKVILRYDDAGEPMALAIF